MIVGNYGSGKTEISVNLALQAASNGLKVAIADLDIVNPYFRCREASQLMSEAGVRVVVPPPAISNSDLPVLMPEIKTMLEPEGNKVSIFDVGGEDTGARLLSTLVEALGSKPYNLWQVINARRPFTSTVEGCLKLMRAIESTSRLPVTGLVGNTHLMAETSRSIVMEGWELLRKVSESSGLPIVFITAPEDMAGQIQGQIDAPVLPLRRYMLPPHLKQAAGATNRAEARLKPIGRP